MPHAELHWTFNGIAWPTESISAFRKKSEDLPKQNQRHLHKGTGSEKLWSFNTTNHHLALSIVISGEQHLGIIPDCQSSELDF